MHQNLCKRFNEFCTIACHLKAVLLFFYDASPFIPIGGNHCGIHSNICRFMSLIDDVFYVIYKSCAYGYVHIFLVVHI